MRAKVGCGSGERASTYATWKDVVETVASARGSATLGKPAMRASCTTTFAASGPRSTPRPIRARSWTTRWCSTSSGTPTSLAKTGTLPVVVTGWWKYSPRSRSSNRGRNQEIADGDAVRGRRGLGGRAARERDPRHRRASEMKRAPPLGEARHRTVTGTSSSILFDDALFLRAHREGHRSADLRDARSRPRELELEARLGLRVFAVLARELGHLEGHDPLRVGGGFQLVGIFVVDVVAVLRRERDLERPRPADRDRPRRRHIERVVFPIRVRLGRCHTHRKASCTRARARARIPSDHTLPHHPRIQCRRVTRACRRHLRGCAPRSASRHQESRRDRCPESHARRTYH